MAALVPSPSLTLFLSRRCRSTSSSSSARGRSLSSASSVVRHISTQKLMRRPHRQDFSSAQFRRMSHPDRLPSLGTCRSHSTSRFASSARSSKDDEHLKNERLLRGLMQPTEAAHRPHENSGKEVDRDCASGIFSIYKNQDQTTINIGKLLTAIEKTGIRRDDHRLEQFLDRVDEHGGKGKLGFNRDNVDLDREIFIKLIGENVVFLSQVFQNKMVIPEFEDFCGQVTEIFESCRENESGKVADYIPQLAKYSPDIWGCSVCTVDGQRFSLGDTDGPFTLQSCSKPFTYAIAMNELGADVVHKYVGHEPSGRNFNEICLDGQNKPFNPMLNSGAIMIASLAHSLMRPEMPLSEKFEFFQNYFRRLTGNQNVGFNNAVFLSERDTADRNNAMAYYMKDYKCFPETINSSKEVHEWMDLYFQFCSMEVDTEGLAVMGATLANGGICPTTGDKVLSASSVRDTLSLMYSCGMYNYSGKFAFRVGLPAKSGVSGSLVLVIPNTMAIALWSPPLDEIGNTARGVQLSQELVDRFNFHRFDNLRYSEKKQDPTKHNLASKSLSTVTLLFAATLGDLSALKRHHLQGIDLNTTDYDGRTALHVAAAEGQLECVKFLLESAEVDPDPQDRWKFTPVGEANRFGHSDVADYLEEYLNKRGIPRPEGRDD